MLSHRQIRRVVVSVGSVVLCWAVVGASALYLRQYVIRRDAKDLLDLVRFVQPRQTTFAELQPRLRRWNGAIHYDGPCIEARCDLRIASPKAMFNEPAGTYFAHTWILRLQTFVGLRPALAVASISVRNGVVCDASFDIEVLAPVHRFARAVEGYTLIGEFETLSRFWNRLDRYRTRLHSNYVVNRPSACDGCALLYVDFTPYAEQDEIEPLMQVNFSCVTAWEPCRTSQELMPAAWGRYIEDEAKLRELPPESSCEGTQLELLGRDAQNVALIEIRNTQRMANDSTRVTARLIERLKRTDFWPVKTDAAFWLPKTHPGLKGYASVHAGERVIALFDYIRLAGASSSAVVRRLLEHPEDIRVDECGLVTPSDQNLRMIKTGIAQDWRAAE